MAMLRMAAVAALVSVALLSGCGKTRKEFERQLDICAVGENNGVLTAAADACGNALDIARQNDFPPDDISDLEYRLGQIARKQGRFEHAEALVRASLDFESQMSDPAGVASRLVELSLSLAGQDRWEKGAELLDRAEPHVRELDGDERSAAANALRGYAAQFGKQGDADAAARFRVLAQELDLPINENTAVP
ncbi:MAG: hypothetical protein OER91_12625 [Gammaproteobacteria bacterium]|nr:hypothetical protein [Gammaproteobacteria bacterium]